MEVYQQTIVHDDHGLRNDVSAGALFRGTDELTRMAAWQSDLDMKTIKGGELV